MYLHVAESIKQLIRHSLTHSFIHSFICPSIHTPTHRPIHPSIHASICALLATLRKSQDRVAAECYEVSAVCNPNSKSSSGARDSPVMLARRLLVLESADALVSDPRCSLVGDLPEAAKRC